MKTGIIEREHIKRDNKRWIICSAVNTSSVIVTKKGERQQSRFPFNCRADFKHAFENVEK